MEHRQAQANRNRLWRSFVLAVVGMLAFQGALLFGEAVSWDYGVTVDSPLALPLAVGALLCILWMNVLLWRLKSLTGDHDVGRYWVYCTIMAVLCRLCQDLDGGGGIPMLIALVSTPLGPVGTLVALAQGVAGYRSCCEASFVFCLAQVVYHHLLLCRHEGEQVRLCRESWAAKL